jgi:hypothetical protein
VTDSTKGETMTTPFTCPQCHRTSHHPEDARHGYCGNCHEFTGAEAPWPLDDENGPDFPARKVAAALGLLLSKLEIPPILPGETLPPGTRKTLFAGNGISLHRGTLWYGMNGEPIALPHTEAFAIVDAHRENEGRDITAMHRTATGISVQMSTAYLGVDLSTFGFGPHPLVWETLVVVGEDTPHILQPWRYTTRAAAHAGHALIAEAVRQGIRTIDDGQ